MDDLWVKFNVFIMTIFSLMNFFNISTIPVQPLRFHSLERVAEILAKLVAYCEVSQPLMPPGMGTTLPVKDIITTLQMCPCQWEIFS